MTQSAIELVRERMAKPRRFRPRRDKAVLCLGVEGGGFSGVISMGMLMALKDLNVLPVFDRFVGCSAGALNLAYTLGEVEDEGLSVYYDHVINHEFFDPKRLVKGKYILDMKVLEMIMRDLVPLPLSTLKAKHPKDFFLCLTSVDENEGQLVNIEQAGTKLLDYLLAGAQIPFFGGGPREVEGRHYFDGTFAYPDMSIAAEAIGATHCLILSTNPEGGLMADRYENVGGRAYKEYMNLKFPALQELWTSRLEYSRQLETIKKDLASSRITSEMVALDKKDYNMAGFTRDQWMIIDGARKGYQTVVKLFHPEASVGLVPEIL